MKTVIFTSKNNIYANKIIKELFLIRNIEIIGIVESNIIYPGKGNASAILSIFRKSGLSYLLSQIIKFSFFKFGSALYSILSKKNRNNILFPYKILSKKINVPIYTEKDINSKTFIEKMFKSNPDLFISVFLNQIFKPELLSIPRIGALNIHPALLPAYRGLSPVFWALANGEKKTGITIHWIDEKIDSGKIISQKEVLILSKDTEFSLYLRCVNEGISLLRTTFDIIESYGKNLFTKKNTLPGYYSFPTKEDVARFKNKGRKFLTLKELLTAC